MSIANPPSLFDSYQPLPDCYDEFVQPDGTVRPQWKALAQRFDQLGSAELLHRWDQAKRFITENGISFVSTNDPESIQRPWEFDFLPVIFTEKDWADVEQGLAQRARILNAIIEDFLGQQTLIREHILPASLLLEHPGFHPSFFNLPVHESSYLHLYAADISRSASGQWYVSADRTRAPFGLGYALENRVVTSRMLSGMFQQLQVHRHAAFYKSLQHSFADLAPENQTNPFIVIWSKGPKSNFHYEDAYLARYLGYTLVEGKDLAVRNGRLALKTLTGLVDVDVVFRRLEEDDMDPVELREYSEHGVSGLLSAIRNRKVMLANAPGSRLVESPVFMPFLNHISQKLYGEKLLIPSVNTWWCGQKKECQYVIEHLEELQIRPAFRSSVHRPPEDPRLMSKAEKAELIQRIKANPSHYVGQSHLQRSTTPSWEKDRLVPWYMALRAFLVREQNDYKALPGGLVRVSNDPNQLEYSMTEGTRSQDAWILSEQPVDQSSLLKPDSGPVRLLRSGNELPSRVADDFFWLGRYLEQSDDEARLLRSVISRLGTEVQLQQLPEYSGLMRILAAFDLIEPGFAIAELQPTLPHPEEVLLKFSQNRSLNDPFLKPLSETVRIAGQLRDRLSFDVWRTIQKIQEFLGNIMNARADIDESEMLNQLNRLISALNSLGGVINESMTRTHGWRFLELGRRMERALMTQTLCGAVLQHAQHPNTSTLELMLEVSDCVMTYRNRYRSRVHLPAVLDILLTDETTPRSIAFQVMRIDELISQLPSDLPQGVYSAERQLSMELLVHLRKLNVVDLASSDSREELNTITTLLNQISGTLSKTYFHHIGNPVQMMYSHSKIE